MNPGRSSLTVCTDMMRISTMSPASAAATERTGRSLQVRLDHFLSIRLVHENRPYCEKHVLN